MILKSFKNFLFLFFFLIAATAIQCEEQIDIWKNKNNSSNQNVPQENLNIEDSKVLDSNFKINKDSEIQIENNLAENTPTTNIYGVYDPEDFNFNVNMWSTTNSEDVTASISRLKKIKLSKTSNDILESILLSFSYPPKGMSDDDFVKLKIDWLIQNDKRSLIENFLKQNQNFVGKSKAVQYLVDKSISQAKITDGCRQIKFIDTTVKDSYLEKFKIYCLVFNNKKSQAQLLLDLLREQKLSDKFFDDKINFLLGITTNTSDKINEQNLLNFYLSSLTVKDFNYQPNKKTKKEIWEYLNSANLIKLDDVKDKQKLRELEMSANLGRIDEKIIFDIYKQIPFSLNTLINAKNLYQTLDESDSRALIYQKFLLSDDDKSKVEYLFLLEELFKKGGMVDLYSGFLSDKLKEIGSENIPNNFKEIAEKKMKVNNELILGKIKYDDKNLHQSKILRFYLEKENEKKVQKDINRIFKKLSKNKKYFYSAKDLALVESLAKDGFDIPSSFNFEKIKSDYEIPKNLLQLIEKDQNAFLALKIVEIIGEDEPYQLDPETIYFITNLLNQIDLVTIRNKVLVSALPKRIQ